MLITHLFDAHLVFTFTGLTFRSIAAALSSSLFGRTGAGRHEVCCITIPLKAYDISRVHEPATIPDAGGLRAASIHSARAPRTGRHSGAGVT